eukprot:gene8087-9951_t
MFTPINKIQSIIENGSIPNQCKELKIDHFLFCHNPLELIPPSVKKLYPIEIFDDSLPKSISSLVLKDIKGISILEIPSSIRQLEISDKDISQLLSNFIIPSTVDEESFQKDLIPESVTKLILKNHLIPLSELKGINDTMFPRGLIHLETDFYIKFSQLGNDEFHLSNLNHLECRVKRITIGMFPSTLKKLILKIPKTLEQSLKDWEIPIGAFPESLELLSIEIPPNQIFKQGIFPNSLKTLKLDIHCNFNIPDIRDQPQIIPLSLNSLTLCFYGAPSQENIPRFFHLMNTLFSVSNSRLEIQIYKTRFISLEGPSDPFLYLQIQNFSKPMEEYFILKSNLYQTLISLLKPS